MTSQLQHAQTQCWLEADAAPLLGLLAADARVVGARSALPGPYDVQFSVQAFGALMRNQCAQPTRAAFDGPALKEPSLSFESQQVHRADARLELSQVRVLQGFSTLERVQEHFVFVERAGSWRIAAFSYHPLSTEASLSENFDSKRLPELDAKAERPSQPPAERAYALFLALRYAEASRAFCDVAAAADATAEDWLLCAQSSLFAGDPLGATSAFDTAHRMDPLLGPK